MAIFRFRKKKVNTTTSSVLRKTKSTGNIIEGTAVSSKVRLVSPAVPTKEPSDGLKRDPLKGRDENLTTTAAAGLETTMIDNRSSDDNNKSNSSTSTNSGNSDSSSSNSSNSDSITCNSISSSDEDESDTKSVSSLPATMTTTIEKPKSEDLLEHLTIPRGGPIAKSNSSPCTPREVARSTNDFFSSDDLELLLSQETEARIEAQEKKAAAEIKPVRQTRLKFALPETPPRSRSPAYSAYSRPRQRWSMPDEKSLQHQQHQHQSGQKKKKAPRMSRWTKIMGGDSSEDEESEELQRPLAVGDKVRLLHRPLPILGYIRYMGPVHFAEGDGWVGVELDSRVGKNDGQVDGKRYFQTDLHRGIFLQKSEVGHV